MRRFSRRAAARNGEGYGMERVALMKENGAGRTAYLRRRALRHIYAIYYARSALLHIYAIFMIDCSAQSPAPFNSA